MKISLSSRERAAIAAVMHRTAWIAGPVMLHQLELYEALQLDEFKGKDAAFLGSKTNMVDRINYEVPEDSAGVLMAVLTIEGQGFDLGLINARTLRRLNPELTAATAPPAPPPAEEKPAEAPPSEDDKETPAPTVVDAPPAEAPATPAAAAPPSVNGVTALRRLVRSGRRHRGERPT